MTIKVEYVFVLFFFSSLSLSPSPSLGLFIVDVYRNNALESMITQCNGININMYLTTMMATAMAVAAENNKLILCDGHIIEDQYCQGHSENRDRLRMRRVERKKKR